MPNFLPGYQLNRTPTIGLAHMFTSKDAMPELHQAFNEWEESYDELRHLEITYDEDLPALKAAIAKHTYYQDKVEDMEHEGRATFLSLEFLFAKYCAVGETKIYDAAVDEHNQRREEVKQKQIAVKEIENYYSSWEEYAYYLRHSKLSTASFSQPEVARPLPRLWWKYDKNGKITKSDILKDSDPAQASAYQQAIKKWYAEIDAILADKSIMTTFPVPPPIQPPCKSHSCSGQGICSHTVQEAFKVLALTQKELKKELLRWHPDKWSLCSETLQKQAEEMFKAIGALLTEE